MKVKEFESFLDQNSMERLRVKLKIEKGELTDVVFQYESYFAEQWHSIVRYDCSHGFFHIDVMKPNGDKEKYVLEMDSLKSASIYAEQDLRDRWEWYRERYIKKLKSIKL